jgi:EAL domain-containing protein (putative c-di-GMP-specific phosphodiesterase class I)
LQLNQPGMLDMACRIVSEAGLKPGQIMFEITESQAMHEAERTTALLREFRARGFDFAIDDFGTGYSSLAYLQKFRACQLKIDRLFIHALDDGGPEARAIITAIIALAHTLGMNVVAEGVESVSQAEQLRTLGCDQLQGFLLSLPMPPAEFERRCLELDAAAALTL